MVRFVLEVDLEPILPWVMWRSVSTAHGGGSVGTRGRIRMPQWPAGNWGFLVEVGDVSSIKYRNMAILLTVQSISIKSKVNNNNIFL